MNPADLLTRVGRALFGDRWKADMAHALKISVDRVDDWSKGRGNPPPQGVWRDLAAIMQDRQEALRTLHAAVLVAADPDPFEVRIGPAIVGTAISPKAIEEINRRFAALPAGHEFEGAVAQPRHGAALVRVPRKLPVEGVEGLKAWVSQQVFDIGDFTIEPYRTRTARSWGPQVIGPDYPDYPITAAGTFPVDTSEPRRRR